MLDRTIDRYKARLVGFNQIEGVDYEEAFSLVVNLLLFVSFLLSQSLIHGLFDN